MKIDEIPYNYAHCYATEEQCKQCSQCLRNTAARMNEELQAEPLQKLMCITPTYIAQVAAGKPCAHFRSNEKQRYAVGMKHLFDQVPKHIYSSVRAQVIGCFSSERMFYHTQSGKQPVSPELQKRILHIFEEAQLALPAFDTYALLYRWVY